MRIAVCDDDPAEQEQFDTALHGWDPTRSAEKFLSGAALLEAARETPPFDIVFLDIYMPGEGACERGRHERLLAKRGGQRLNTTGRNNFPPL